MFHYSRRNTLQLVRYSIWSFIFLGLASASLLAQVTSGTIFGRVKDVSGAYIANATITVKSPDTGAMRTVTSSATGDFVVPNMPPGTYAISIEAPDFKKLDRQGVVLSAADKLNAGEFVLAIGGTAETVNVMADAGQLQLQSSSGERSDLISSKQLNDVALNGRMILDYIEADTRGGQQFRRVGLDNLGHWRIY